MDKFETLMEENLQQYETEEREMLILTEEECIGAGLIKDDLWQPVVYSLAAIDIESDTFITDNLRFHWLAKGSERNGWVHNLKPLTIYRIKARHIKKECRNPRIVQDIYYLSKVIERNLADERLEKVLVEYKEPKYISICDLGNFELEKMYNWYAKEVVLGDEKCRVLLECHSLEKGNADIAKQSFEKIYESFTEWNQKIKKFAAGEMTDLANDWAEDGEEITEECFMRRMKLHTLWLNPEGGYSVSYEDDDMSAGHYITVESSTIDKREYVHL